MASEDPLFRYSRQMLVPYIGREGQERLRSAKVGLIGCGALGSAVANNLVRAGVGLLRIADKDYPEIHNLHRQVLFTEQDVARRVPKAEAAAAHLRAVNSEVALEPVVGTIDADSIAAFRRRAGYPRRWHGQFPDAVPDQRLRDRARTSPGSMGGSSDRAACR